jgi:hypothetical protein
MRLKQYATFKYMSKETTLHRCKTESNVQLLPNPFFCRLKERNLLDSKLIEFNNLLRHPYIAPSKPAPAGQSPLFGAAPNAIPATAQNAAPPSVSSFAQLETSLNTGFGTRHHSVR